MEKFKLSKTGIIIIVIAAVIVVLMCAIFYVAGKKAAEIRQKNGENSTDKRERQDADGKTEAVGASISDELYYPIFEDKIAGKLSSSEAVKKSGLSIGTFYRKFRNYEASK